jgi:MFS family permease
LTEGLRLLVANRYLRALTTHAAVYNLAAQIFTINLVLWMVQGRQVTPAAYGLALSAGGVGAILGTLTALRLADRLGFGRAFAASLLLSCFVPLTVAGLPLYGTALAVGVGGALLVSGIGLGNANVYSLTLRQTVIPADQLRAQLVPTDRSCMAPSPSVAPWPVSSARPPARMPASHPARLAWPCRPCPCSSGASANCPPRQQRKSQTTRS